MNVNVDINYGMRNYAVDLHLFVINGFQILRGENRMLRKTVIATLLAGLGFVASNAMAADASGWYAGASLGSATTSIDSTNIVTGATAFSFSKDESDTGYKLFGGYRLNQNFAVEGGYTNFGKFKATENVTAPAVGSVTGNIKADGWQLGLVGFLPVAKDFSLIGKIGTIYSTTSTDMSTSGAVVLSAGSLASRKHSEWNWTYGLGLQYELSKAVAVRAEWERYDKLGNTGAYTGTGESDVNLYSVGLSYKF